MRIERLDALPTDGRCCSHRVERRCRTPDDGGLAGRVESSRVVRWSIATIASEFTVVPAVHRAATTTTTGAAHTPTAQPYNVGQCACDDGSVLTAGE
jgi:hypothetical protein